MNKKKPTILIIEDEKLVSKAIKGKLEDNNFEVLTAGDGQEGLEIALEKRPDLILLDIVLPVMDGMTVLNKLRDDPRGAKVPVVILSNLSRGTTVEESKKLGVSTYLVKTDWKLQEVIDKVKYELGIL